MARHYEWEDYFWPGTTVLANRLGLTDAAALRSDEYQIASDRQEEIARGEVAIERTFDAAHLCAVHGHLFGDVYEWAGQWRTVDMMKDRSAFAPTPDGIRAHLEAAAEVAAGTDWARLDREGFGEAMAAFYAELNYAHPFREGNGRAGKLVIGQLAERGPWALDWDRIRAEDWNSASALSHPPPFAPGVPYPEALVGVFGRLTR